MIGTYIGSLFLHYFFHYQSSVRHVGLNMNRSNKIIQYPLIQISCEMAVKIQNKSFRIICNKIKQLSSNFLCLISKGISVISYASCDVDFTEFSNKNAKKQAVAQQTVLVVVQYFVVRISCHMLEINNYICQENILLT